MTSATKTNEKLYRTKVGSSRTEISDAIAGHRRSPRGFQAWELPEMKTFQTRSGNHLWYSALDACELGVRDARTRMLVRKERTLMTNSEIIHKIVNMRCSHHTKHAHPKETHSDIYPVKLCRGAVQQILKMERWNLVQHVLQQATLTQTLTAVAREIE